MTDKRFNRVGGYVYDGENCISHFEDVAHRDDIITLLNELHEENEQLKQQLKNIRRLVNEAYTTERTHIGKNTLKQLQKQIE